jgi:hypothetical protein
VIAEKAESEKGDAHAFLLSVKRKGLDGWNRQ